MGASAALAPLLVSRLMNSLESASMVVTILVGWQVMSAAASIMISQHLLRTSLLEVAAASSATIDTALRQSDKSGKTAFSLGDWWTLPKDVRGAMCPMVILYCTVLGGGGAGLTAWLTKHISVATIALWRSSMQVIGFIGAALAPVLI